MMNMITGKLQAILLSLLLMVFMVPQAAVASPDADGIVAVSKAGIGPDSMFYALDRMLDRIGLALAFGSESRAEKAIAVAGERLAESKRMIELGKMDAARIAQAEHAHALKIVESSVMKFHSDNSQESLLKESSIVLELERHESEVSRVRESLEAENALSVSQGALDIIIPIKQRVAEARAGASHSESRSVVVVSTDASDSRSGEGVSGGRGSSVESQHSDSSRSRTGRSDAAKIQVRTFGDNSRVRVDVEFSTPSTDINAVIGEMLEMVKLSKADIASALDFGVENHPEELRERMRARARHRDGVTHAELRLEFPLNTAGRQAVVDGIFEKLDSLTAAGIRKAITFEVRSDETELNTRGREGSDVRRHDDEGEIRGRDDENEIRGRDETEVRGRDSENELRGRDSETEARGRESEVDEKIRGNSDEDEVRGRESEAEVRGRDDETEVRGRDSENELRGREAEGEAPRGSDDNSDDDNDDSSSRNRGGRGSGRGGG